ncbi:diguanylate cyclase [Parahaliea mediterranea]|uniref:Diguanylate cyclase DosC n=1 Tax=Parahaliea mediterranea TaxID=651086 RepID=A0A939DIQ7_9GAMM|nr:diguanylate cyclase [Parahaliea mediterranea]MBN7798581.1 diguanylate cyclase [Parahaliea mediterranea]
MPEHTPIAELTTEWKEYFSGFSAGTHDLVRELAGRHCEALATVFYEKMLENATAQAFLSHDQVRERLHASMQQWILAIFNCQGEKEIGEAITHQVTIGQVHARISVPVHLVLRGSRHLKDAFISHIGASPRTTPEEKSAAIRLAVGTIDLAMEVMSHAYSTFHDRNSKAKEGYRLFSLTQNIASERERQRSSLLDWENQLMFGHAVGLGEHQITDIRASEFGLWFSHKGAHAFEGTSEVNTILDTMDRIDTALLPALLAARDDRDTYIARLRELRDQVRAVTYHLDRLFEQNNELESGRDVLTRLLNRKFLPVVLTRQVAHCNRHGQQFALLAIDVDHFKQINDTHGHEAGDAVLQQLAVLLINQCRGGDYLFRLGGEEFLVLMVDIDGKSAAHRAEELREAIARESFSAGTDGHLRVTVSIGLALFDGHPDYQRQLSRADDALYRAKNGGRNQVAIDGG